MSASSLLKQKIGKDKEKEKEEERQQQLQTTLFAGLTFFFDKDTISSLSARHKITQLAKHHQASVSLLLSKKTTHYVIDLPSSLLRSIETSPSITSHSLIYKLNTAIKLNIKIVTIDFIYASITGLQLALQHVIEYPHEIRLLAPEIPVFCSRDDITTTEPPPGETNAADIAIIEPTQVDTLPDDKSSFSAASEFSVIVSADFFPTRLQSPVLSKFSPKQVEEKGVLCNLMSQIETVNEGCSDELTLSFEESRFYKFFMNNGVTSEMSLDIPTRAEEKMGSVWSWGSGFKGQLGNGDRENGMQPDYIIMGEGSSSSVVSQVSCGDRHSAAVDQQGEVWCWGYGCEGALGQGEFKNSSYPLLVDAFSSIKVCMVACGRAHTAVLTSIGTVWSWGSNKSMQLGYSVESYAKSATPLELFAIKDAVYVACGGNNTAVIDRTAKMFTLGCNAHGQRGVGKQKLKSPAPTVVSFPGKATVSYANVGHGFMGAIVESGTLYMWGRNLDSQCGNGSAHDLYTPQKVDVGTEVIQFSCGDTHTACVTSNGDVFTWGWGPAGQLGHTSDMAICTEPTQVEVVTNASMVCCGARHTVALTDQGKIWSWGANDSGQTGLPIFDYYFSDDEEDSDEEEEEDEENDSSDLDAEWISPHVVDTMSKVAMIACGREHALALVQGDYVPIQFTKDDNEDALFNWIETNVKLRNMDDAAFKDYLQNIRDDEYGTNFSLLHLATFFGNEDVVNLLLSQNWIDVEILDSRGDTPLHVSAERDLEGCCRILLDAGAKPDKKNNDGKTPIHIAVENRSMEVLSEIVESSISNKSAIDNVGNTPLHYAVHLEHFEMAKYLIERAAQPQILDKSGKTALDYCSRSQASYFKSVAQKNDVFISYAHVDIVFAEKIKEYLESFAIKCWMDTARLEAGSDWRLDIGNGVLNSRLILFVGSRASVVSDWCIKELHMAKKHNLVIIPIWHQKVEFDSEVKSLIFGRSFLDFSETKYFEPNGKKLAKKLKGALTLLKLPKSNPYMQIPVLTTEQLWKQQFLSVLIEGHQQQQSACKLEDMLHNSAIFSVIHTLNLQSDSPFYKEREANINKCWGLVLLISDLGLARASIDKWWTFAEANNKKVYLCIIKGDASNIKTSDLPDQLRSENAPIFYLESVASIQQLIFFIHLSQREQFMASQVTVMEDKLDVSSTALRNNETEITALKKRFYVE